MTRESRLDHSGQQEFNALFRRFQESLRQNGIFDGYDLAADWSVRLADGVWAISDGTKVLDGVTSERREVIEALYDDGVRNLNR